MTWRVEGAVAGASNLQLREASGRVGIKLHPGRPRGGRVLDHKTGRGGRGRIGDAQHPRQAFGLVSRSSASRCWRRPRLGCPWCHPAGRGTPARSRLSESGFALGWWLWPRPPLPSLPSTVTPLVPPLIVSRSSPILADTALVRMAAKQAPAMFSKPLTEAQLLERFQSCLKTSAQGVKFVKLKATLANVRFWDCEGKCVEAPGNLRGRRILAAAQPAASPAVGDESAVCCWSCGTSSWTRAWKSAHYNERGVAEAFGPASQSTAGARRTASLEGLQF